MSKRNVREKPHANEAKLPENLQYSKLPKEVEQIIEPAPDVTEDTATLSNDGVQFLARIPQDIARAIGVKKGDVLKFRVVRHSPRLGKGIEVTIEYVKKE